MSAERPRAEAHSAGPGLAASDPASPFVRAVAHQVTYALGADPDALGGSDRALQAEQRTVAILRDAGALGGPSADPPPDDVVRRLLAEPAMLAAFFQNLDLLFDHGAPGARVVSLLLMRAMEL